MGLVTHTQTTLFAAVQAQLLIALPQSLGRPVDTVLRFFGYSGLFLNLGATLSAILLLIAVASLPAAARGVYISCSHSYPRKLVHDPHGSHNTDLNRLLLDRDGESQLLRAFGIARGWGILLRHCIFCFLGGWVCAFLHIVINLWLSQSHLVAALIMPSAFLQLSRHSLYLAFTWIVQAVKSVMRTGTPSCSITQHVNLILHNRSKYEV